MTEDSMDILLPILLALVIWPISLLLKKLREKWPTTMLFMAIFILAVLDAFFPPERTLYSYLLFALFGFAGVIKSVKVSAAAREN